REQASVLLSYTFGVRGQLAVGDRIIMLRKTSPSGGGLHPIEAYPLALRLDGIDPGLYRYDARGHALEPIQLLEHADAVAAAGRFAAGQAFFADAALLVLLVARFT